MTAIVPCPRATPSKTWSVTGRHEFTIESYSATKGLGVGMQIPSCPFAVGGHLWKIVFYPDGEDENHTNSVGVLISLISSHLYDPLHDEEAEGTEKEVVASYGFQFLDGIGRPISPLKLNSSPRSFSRSRYIRGFGSFMSHSELEASPFLHHGDSDILVIRCILTVYHSYPSPRAALPSPSVSGRYYHLHNMSSLQEHLYDLLNNGHTSDITLTAGNETFKAHRCVLFARSRVFKEQSLLLPSGTNFPVDEDIDSDIFKAVLHFLYTDALPPPGSLIVEGSDKDDSILKTHRVLVAADRYGVDKLKLICEDSLCNNITLATAGQTLTLAKKLNCLRLKALTVDFITKFATHIRNPSSAQSEDSDTPRQGSWDAEEDLSLLNLFEEMSVEEIRSEN